MEIIQPRKERKRNIESSAKQGLKWQKYISINNHLKYQWFECTNQKIQSGRLDKKQEPTICCLQETHLRAKDTYTLKVRGWGKIVHTNGQDRKAGELQYSYQTKETLKWRP